MAVTKASLPARDFKVYSVLLNRAAQWNTAEIDSRWQPRSLTELSAWCHLPRSVLAVSLNHLEQHKWIERHRWKTPGRGHSTWYQLSLGGDCDCRPPQPEPASDAERTRRYRARKKASGQSVTQAPEKASGIHVTEDAKASGIHVTKRPASRDDAAGQAPFSAKEGVEEGEVRREAALCSVCGNVLDLVLPPAGYRTHPCCDPAEQSAEGWQSIYLPGTRQSRDVRL